MAPGPDVPSASSSSSSSSSSPASSFPNIPPFPSDVPTCPLVRISLARLLHGNEEEEERLWRACCELGFFYIDLRTQEVDFDGGAVGANARQVEVHVDGEQLLEDADKLFEVEKEFFDLPVEEKVRYDFSAEGSYFGYKGYGAGVVDASGTADRNEFYNTSKDDILATAPPLPAPSLLAPHRPLLASFIRESHSLVALVLRTLNARLALPPNTLPSLHRLTAPSGDQVRFVRAPPQPRDDRRVALGEHTDFGSVTVLFNRVGGLQVLLPPPPPPPPGGTEEAEHPDGGGGGGGATTRMRSDSVAGGKGAARETWAYVRPLPGHAVVNLGDALVKMTSGILRSSIHRVVSPPGEQAAATRYSLVYFARPEDDVVLRVLEGSERIEEKVRESGERLGREREEREVSAKEWILRRALARRTGGKWEDGVGTEEVSRRRGKAEGVAG